MKLVDRWATEKDDPIYFWDKDGQYKATELEEKETENQNEKED